MHPLRTAAPVRRAMTIALGLFLCLAAAGCDSRGAAVKEAMDQLIAANDARNGEAVASMYSRNTIEHYDHLLKLAATATKDQLWQLSLEERQEVISIRADYTLAEIKALDGRSFVRRCVSEGKWVVEWGVEDYGGIQVGDTTAWMKVKKPDDRPAPLFGRRRQRDTRHTYKVRFYLEDGAWKLDETSLYDLWNEVLRDDLTESGMTEEEFLLNREDQDKPLPKTILDAPRR